MKYLSEFKNFPELNGIDKILTKEESVEAWIELVKVADLHLSNMNYLSGPKFEVLTKELERLANITIGKSTIEYMLRDKLIELKNALPISSHGEASIVEMGKNLDFWLIDNIKFFDLPSCQYILKSKCFPYVKEKIAKTIWNIDGDLKFIFNESNKLLSKDLIIEIITRLSISEVTRLSYPVVIHALASVCNRNLVKLTNVKSSARFRLSNLFAEDLIKFFTELTEDNYREWFKGVNLNWIDWCWIIPRYMVNDNAFTLTKKQIDYLQKNLKIR